MENVARAVVHDAKIELVDEMELPEGAHLLVTRVSEEDEAKAFWLLVSQSAMKNIWDNPEDDVYEALLGDDR
jgi:hypothetical protein